MVSFKSEVLQEAFCVPKTLVSKSTMVVTDIKQELK